MYKIYKCQNGVYYGCIGDEYCTKAVKTPEQTVVFFFFGIGHAHHYLDDRKNATKATKR